MGSIPKQPQVARGHDHDHVAHRGRTEPTLSIATQTIPCCATVYQAILKNHLECLKHLCNTDPHHYYEYIRIAAKMNRLDMVRYLHSKGYPWDVYTSQQAVQSGHLEILKYLHENNCPVDDMICDVAAREGHVEIIQYLHQLHFPWDEVCCQEAAKKGHLHVLRYLHENGCPFDEMTFIHAAQAGSLELIEYLHNHGCSWGKSACQGAIDFGHLDVLKYLHKHVRLNNPLFCITAATNGHMHILHYLHESGCPWNESACYAAANAGHFKCLVYLHEHGCPWNEHANHIASYRGHYQCHLYMLMNGCPWEKNELLCNLCDSVMINDTPMDHLRITCGQHFKECFRYGIMSGEYDAELMHRTVWVIVNLIGPNECPWFHLYTYMKMGVINEYTLHIHHKVKRIQHAWLRYAFDPNTSVGHTRLCRTITELNDIVAIQ